MKLISGLLDERIAIMEGKIGDFPADLFPDEEAFISTAVERRRREFTAGRACARHAMLQLGIAAVSLPPQEDRVPKWPGELVGSITHDETHVAAAVARRSDGFRSVGIDVEPYKPLPWDLWESILRPHELSKIEKQNSLDPGIRARAIFCAKECAFKCQYGVTRAMIEFHDLEIELDESNLSFKARLMIDAESFPPNEIPVGRLRINKNFISAAMSIGSIKPGA